jgi:hypothetical protein
MKTDKELNPYFALHYGHKILESKIIFEAPHTIHAVRALETAKEMDGQLTLPNPDTGESDILWSMPKKVKERRDEIEERLEKVREELRRLS